MKGKLTLKNVKIEVERTVKSAPVRPAPKADLSALTTAELAAVVSEKEAQARRQSKARRGPTVRAALAALTELKKRVTGLEK